MKFSLMVLTLIAVLLSCTEKIEHAVISPTDNDSTGTGIDDSSPIDDTKKDSTTTPIIITGEYDDTTVIFDERDEPIAYPANSPVAINGQLQVIGNSLCNENGIPIQLRGMSSMGLQWRAAYMNPTLFDTLAYDWGADIVRVAVYVGEGGYMHVGTSVDGNLKDSTQRAATREQVDQMIYEIGERGMYCLIDWHTLSPGNPWFQHEAGLEFWKYMGKKHANKTHVLFEVFNEPNKSNNPEGSDPVKWSMDAIDKDLKALAEIYIPIIRSYDTSKSIVIVGNETWSSEPEEVIDDMLEYDNIMYTYHYYADLHGELSDEKKEALLTVPVFVTEWGWGETEQDYALAKSFIDWMSVHKISWIKWALQAGDHHGTFINDIPLGPYYNNYNPSGVISRWNIKYPADNFDGRESGPFTITKQMIGDGSITITPEKETYEFGDVVTIEAIPGAGMELSSWYHDTILTDSKFEFTVDNSSIFKAIFKDAGNEILNGKFNNGEYPWIVDEKSGESELTIVDGKATIITTKETLLVKIAKFYQNAMTMSAGSYTLSFDCYSNIDRLINVNVTREIGNPETVPLDVQDIEITTTPQTFLYDFEFEFDPRLDMKDMLEFSIGGYADTLVFDNISIRKNN